MMNPPPSEQRSTWTLAAGLIISVIFCFAAGGIGGFATSASVDGDWFVNLKKPEWNPPNWVFGPVWSTLYFMMAIAAWLVWKQPNSEGTRFALGFFGFHLILNILWSVLFFTLQQPGWATIEIVVLWLAILVVTALFYQKSKWAAALMIPYLLWVSFASILNYSIWNLN